MELFTFFFFRSMSRLNEPVQPFFNDIAYTKSGDSNSSNLLEKSSFSFFRVASISKKREEK